MDKIDELLQYVRKTNPEMTDFRVITKPIFDSRVVEYI